MYPRCGKKVSAISGRIYINGREEKQMCQEGTRYIYSLNDKITKYRSKLKQHLSRQPDSNIAKNFEIYCKRKEKPTTTKIEMATTSL